MRGEAWWEKKLNIYTAAADYEREDNHHSRYEPTSYAVLDRLARSGFINHENVLVDYGSGKGRVGIFMNRMLGCRTIGVEYNASLVARAEENYRSCFGRDCADASVRFVCENAENYAVGKADAFYFFNPFSSRILQSVLQRIYESYCAFPREMRLYFYYAMDDYLSVLMTDDRFEYIAELDCRDLFHNEDFREKILVFRIA